MDIQTVGLPIDKNLKTDHDLFIEWCKIHRPDIHPTAPIRIFLAGCETRDKAIALSESWVKHHKASVELKCKLIEKLEKAITDIERLNTGPNYEGRIYDITRSFNR